MVSQETDESLQETKKLNDTRRKAVKVLFLGKIVALTPYVPRVHCIQRSDKSTSLENEHPHTLLVFHLA